MFEIWNMSGSVNLKCNPSCIWVESGDAWIMLFSCELEV